MAEKSGMQFQVDAHFLAFVATRSVSVVRRKVALASQLRFGFMDRPPGIVFRVVLVGRSEGSDLSNHFFGRSAFCQRVSIACNWHHGMDRAVGNLLCKPPPEPG